MTFLIIKLEQIYLFNYDIVRIMKNMQNLLIL